MSSNTLKEWVDLYSDDLYSWARYKLSDKEVAQDLVQDTFLSALQNINRFQGKSSPKTWLFSILNNKIVDHFRKQSKSISFSQVLGERHDSSVLEHLFEKNGHWKKKLMPQKWGVSDVHLLDDESFVAILESCMARLPTNWGMAMQLKYLEERDGKEICQELDISPSNFWQILHRAKLQLRQCLEKNWFKK
jgi:RNA polymerase sigma-70 factor (TIGR02943 family)